MKETDALRGIAGVSHFLIRANDEDTAADTIPANTLAVLVQGGNANRIAGMVFHGMRFHFKRVLNDVRVKRSF